MYVCLRAWLSAAPVDDTRRQRCLAMANNAHDTAAAAAAAAVWSAILAAPSTARQCTRQCAVLLSFLQIPRLRSRASAMLSAGFSVL